MPVPNLTYSQFLETMPDAALLVSRDLKIVLANSQACILFGYLPGELQEQSFQTLVPETSRALLAQHIAGFFASPGTSPMGAGQRLSGRRKDGREFAAEIMLGPVATGEALVAVCVIRDITERMQMEAALRESERFARSTLDALPAHIAILDEAGTIVAVNRAWRNFAQANGGHPRQTAEGANYLAVCETAAGYRVEGAAETAAGIRAVMRAEQDVFTLEYPCHSPAEKRWFQARVTCFEAGGPTRAVVAHGDITQRKLAEESLRDGEAQYRLLIENTPEVIYQVALQADPLRGQVTYVSPQAQNFIGFSVEEVMAAPDLWVQAIHPDDLPSVVQSTQALLAQRTPGRREYRLYNTHLSAYLWVEDNVVPLYDARGQAIGYQGVARDITERKRAEAQLRYQASLVEHAHDAIITTDTADNIQSLNPAAEALYGWPAVEVIGQPLHEIIKQEYIDEPRENAIRAVVEAGHWKGEVTQHRRDGARLDILASVSTIKDAQGNPAGFVSINRDITKRKQAEAQLQLRLSELETVANVSTALRAAQTLDEMLPIILDETLAVLHAHAGRVVLHDPASGELRPAVGRNWFAEADQTPQRPGEGIAGRVFASGEAHLSREFASDPQVRPTSRPLIPAGWGGACVPIRTSQAVIGVLFVSVALPRELTPDEVRLLTTLAEMAGNAIQRTRLHEQTQQRYQRVQALHAIDMTIAASFDLRLVLDAVLAQAVTQMGVDAAAVMLLSPGSTTLEVKAARGFRSDAIYGLRVRLGESFSGQAAQERRVVHVSDLQSVADQLVQPDTARREAFVAFFAAPLIAKGEVVGVLELLHRGPLQPDPEWLEFVEALAGQAAIAVDNARLFTSLQRSNRDLFLAYDATIEGWSRALDLRDKETEGHTQRVTELTLGLARAMGINDDPLGAIRWGAMLHDIGKMGIPDDILLKPGPLSPEEWSVMRRHPQYAHDVLAPIAYLRSALDIPFCHHEKWDGTGYPRGLKGEAIPLAARLFAVADVWDALCSSRPYRAAWPREKVRAYLLEQVGAHFDPKVVDVFLLMVA